MAIGFGAAMAFKARTFQRNINVQWSCGIEPGQLRIGTSREQPFAAGGQHHFTGREL